MNNRNKGKTFVCVSNCIKSKESAIKFILKERKLGNTTPLFLHRKWFGINAVWVVVTYFDESKHGWMLSDSYIGKDSDYREWKISITLRTLYSVNSKGEIQSMI